MISRLSSSLMLASTLCKQTTCKFSYIPDKFSRYFILKYSLVPDFAYKRVSSEKDHYEKVKTQEESGNILFAGDSVNSDSAFYLFNADNEIEPFDFLKQDPYYLNGLVAQYSISEIEMPKRSDSKGLLTSDKFN